MSQCSFAALVVSLFLGLLATVYAFEASLLPAHLRARLQAFAVAPPPSRGTLQEIQDQLRNQSAMLSRLARMDAYLLADIDMLRKRVQIPSSASTTESPSPLSTVESAKQGAGATAARTADAKEMRVKQKREAKQRKRAARIRARAAGKVTAKGHGKRVGNKHDGKSEVPGLTPWPKNWTRLSKLNCLHARAVPLGEATIRPDAPTSSTAAGVQDLHALLRPRRSDEDQLIHECVSRCDALAQMAALYSAATKDMLGGVPAVGQGRAPLKPCDAVTVARPVRGKREAVRGDEVAPATAANCFYWTALTPSDCKRDVAFDTFTAPRYGDWRWRLPRFAFGGGGRGRKGGRRGSDR